MPTVHTELADNPRVPKAQRARAIGDPRDDECACGTVRNEDLPSTTRLSLGPPLAMAVSDPFPK